MTTIQTTSTSAVSGTDRRGDVLLIGAAWFFTVAVLLHGADHARRGAETLSTDVFVLGTSAVALEIAVVVLACQRHRLAPLAAAVTGFSLAAGYVLVHFLPTRSWASDSFTGASDVSPVSWAAASLEVIAATGLGLIGLVVLARRGGLASAAEEHRGQASLRTGATHPAAVAMTVGNLIILAVSFAQL